MSFRVESEEEDLLHLSILFLDAWIGGIRDGVKLCIKLSILFLDACWVEGLSSVCTGTYLSILFLDA